MRGFLTQLRVEEMSSRFPSPLAFLNRFSRFNLTSKLVNDTQNNQQQYMVMESYVKNNPEPYFINSFSRLRKTLENQQVAPQSQKIGPYKMNTTITINWAQLQVDIVSPNESEIESVHRLVLPSASIPNNRVQSCQPEQMRITENDAELKPVCFVSKTATGICQNGTWYFKANASKQEPKQQQKLQRQKQPLYSIDVNVTPVECPICHRVVIEMNGMRLESEYANKTNWQGHSMFINMHKSYLEKLPIHNKTKEVIRRYSKSRDMDQVKLGYTVKANQSEDRYFYEIGYHLGDKKLAVLTNLTLPSSEPILCALRLNVTCQECLVLTNASFKTGFGIVYNESIPKLWRQQANSGNALDVAFDFQQQDGIEFGLGFYSEMYSNITLIHLASRANVSFGAGYSYVSVFYPEDRYVYEYSLNVTRIQEGDKSTPTIYRIAYPLSVYQGAPKMIGNFTVSEKIVRAKDQLSNICNVGEPCLVYSLDMAQVNKIIKFEMQQTVGLRSR